MTNLVQLLFEFILNLFLSLVNIILLPISILIDNYIPDISTGLQAVSDGLSWLLNFIQFIIGWVHIPNFAMNLLLSYFVFVIAVRPAITGVKIILSWYKSVK